MGQQQLLLLVLGIVIVGLAVVVGIQAFGENQKKANADALVNDGVRIASDAQAWALKPAAFGGPKGGASPEDIGDVTFADIGYDATSSVYTNLNTGSATGDGFTLTSGTGCVLIVGKSPNNTVNVKVTGTTPNAIETAVNPGTALACS